MAQRRNKYRAPQSTKIVTDADRWRIYRSHLSGYMFLGPKSYESACNNLRKVNRSKCFMFQKSMIGQLEQVPYVTIVYGWSAGASSLRYNSQ